MTEQEFQQYIQRVAPHLADTIKWNSRVYKNAPHFVRDYQNDTVAIVVGGKVVAGGVQ